MSDRNPFRCQYISERHGIQCSLPRHHVDSMDPEKQAHRAWDDNGIPTLKVYVPRPSDTGESDE